MLNVLRYAGVFKKLQLNDLTKYLIGRLTVAERTATLGQNVKQQKQPLQQRSQQPQSQSRDFHNQSETGSERNQHQPHQLVVGPKSASAVLASASGGGLVFGNRSTLTDLTSTGANVQHHQHINNHHQQQQTAPHELGENSEASDCDLVMESASSTDIRHETQVEAIKAAAAAASSSSLSSSKNESCPGASSSADIIKFLELVGSLKHIKRTGWVMRNVNDCESISGHMYRMGMMTYLLDGKDGLDRTKCLELAMVHDLAECVVGDITPFCGVSREEKKLRELQAMEEICKLIEPYGRKVLELFQEYENAQTAESKFVKDLDRLDLVLQAFEYEKRDDCVMKHQEFFDSTDGKFEHPFVRQLVEEINVQRRQLAAQKQSSATASVMNGSGDFTNGHHVVDTSDDDAMTDNHISNGHHEDVSGAKKASTS